MGGKGSLGAIGRAIGPHAGRMHSDAHPLPFPTHTHVPNLYEWVCVGAIHMMGGMCRTPMLALTRMGFGLVPVANWGPHGAKHTHNNRQDRFIV